MAITRIRSYGWLSNGNGDNGGASLINTGDFYISHAYLVNKITFYYIVVVRARLCLSMYSLLSIPASKLLALEMVVRK